jgi:hypothetical protein
MRALAVAAFLFLALGSAVCAVMSAVAGYDVLSSVQRDPARMPLNVGVFLNAFLAIAFVAAAILLIRSGDRGEK